MPDHTDWAKFMAPDAVNDSARQMMGRISRLIDLAAAVAAGSPKLRLQLAGDLERFQRHVAEHFFAADLTELDLKMAHRAFQRCVARITERSKQMEQNDLHSHGFGFQA